MKMEAFTTSSAAFIRSLATRTRQKRLSETQNASAASGMNAGALNSDRVPLTQAIHNDSLRLMVLGHRTAIKQSTTASLTTTGTGTL